MLGLAEVQVDQLVHLLTLGLDFEAGQAETPNLFNGVVIDISHQLFHLLTERKTLKLALDRALGNHDHLDGAVLQGHDEYVPISYLHEAFFG